MIAPEDVYTQIGMYVKQQYCLIEKQSQTRKESSTIAVDLKLLPTERGFLV